MLDAHSRLRRSQALAFFVSLLSPHPSFEATSCLQNFCSLDSDGGPGRQYSPASLRAHEWRVTGRLPATSNRYVLLLGDFVLLVKLKSNVYLIPFDARASRYIYSIAVGYIVLCRQYIWKLDNIWCGLADRDYNIYIV